MAKLLLIEDDLSIRRMLETYFQQRGFDVVVAGDGEAGITLLRQETIDLVITDLLMPGKEGFETIREVRQSFPEMKIIALSGGGRNAPDTYLQFARSFGADAALAKPVELKSLLQTVNDLLAGRQSE